MYHMFCMEIRPAYVCVCVCVINLVPRLIDFIIVSVTGEDLLCTVRWGLFTSSSQAY